MNDQRVILSLACSVCLCVEREAERTRRSRSVRCTLMVGAAGRGAESWRPFQTPLSRQSAATSCMRPDPTQTRRRRARSDRRDD